MARLVSEHRSIGAALQLLASSTDPHRLVVDARSFGHLLKRHTQLEIDVFYPVAHALLTAEGLPFAATSAVEHEALLALLAMLEDSTPDEPSYLPRIDVLTRYLAQHMAEEETLLFRALETRGYGDYSVEFLMETDPPQPTGPRNLTQLH